MGGWELGHMCGVCDTLAVIEGVSVLINERGGWFEVVYFGDIRVLVHA